MSLTIYGSIGSRASRCIWVAEEAGVAYDWKSISTLDGSNKTPEYLEINASGKIPAMTDTGDVVATESLAINQYIAENYGQGGLWPIDRSTQAKVLQWTFWSATEIEYYIGAIFPHLVMKSAEDRDQPFVDRLVGEMLPKLGELETALEGRDYVLDSFTLADVSLAVQTFTIVDRFGLDLSKLPNIVAWTNRCRARPARAKVEALLAAAKR